MASEKNETAMQKMVEWLDTIQVDYREISITSVLNYAIELRAKEKQQIKDAYWAGIGGFINDYPDDEMQLALGENTIVGGGAEKYYKKTYSK